MTRMAIVSGRRAARPGRPYFSRPEACTYGRENLYGET